MMSWSETMHLEYIAGSCSTIPNRTAVADLLDVEWYKARWPDIPHEELDASSVEFPFEDYEGNDVSKKVLLRKRRVPEAALKGEEPVPVCADCRRELWKSRSAYRMDKGMSKRIIIVNRDPGWSSDSIA